MYQHGLGNTWQTFRLDSAQHRRVADSFSGFESDNDEFHPRRTEKGGPRPQAVAVYNLQDIHELLHNQELSRHR